MCPHHLFPPPSPPIPSMHACIGSWARTMGRAKCQASLYPVKPSPKDGPPLGDASCICHCCFFTLWKICSRVFCLQGGGGGLVKAGRVEGGVCSHIRKKKTNGKLNNICMTPKQGSPPPIHRSWLEEKHQTNDCLLFFILSYVFDFECRIVFEREGHQPRFDTFSFLLFVPWHYY